MEHAKLRGQNEQLLRDVADLQRRQKDIAQGVDERLRQFEPVKVTVDGLEFQADADEKRDFEAALAVFSARANLQTPKRLLPVLSASTLAVAICHRPVFGARKRTVRCAQVQGGHWQLQDVVV